ncbi:class E sortase, partial [Leucobacter soli]
SRAPGGSGRNDRPRRRRKRLSPLTVIGELLVVGGVAVLGFFGWQYAMTQIVVPAQQQALAAQDSARWAAASQAEEPWDGEVPVTAAHAPGEVFGLLHIPAIGERFTYRVAEGTDPETVLNVSDKGIGRYETTQMPGDYGNLGLAAHRSGPWITPFREVMELRVGDPIYLETEDGWYTYRFRSLEYVLPSAYDVLNPFPRIDVDPAEDRLMTLTTCHPKNGGTEERAIAYAVFDRFQPRSAGAPAELAAIDGETGEAAV